MRKVLKFIGLAVGGVVGLIVIVILGALGTRAVVQANHVKLTAIETPNGIQEKRFVRINGIDQYIEIRGQDRNNPVLLFLHGGPGSPMESITYKMFLPLEKQFTVVHWDQRGAGRTYARNSEKAVAPTMTIPVMADDTIALAEFLKKHLNKQKIGVVAASGGTTFGLVAAKKRPDLFYAYVGTGQLISVVDAQRGSYDYALTRARKENNAEAVRELESISPTTNPGGFDPIQQKWVSYYAPASERAFLKNSRLLPIVLTAPGFTFKDIQDMGAGAQFTTRTLLPSFATFDVRTYGLDYGAPLFFFQGDQDRHTPTNLVQAFLDQAQAPHKEMVILKGGGHTAALALSDQFIAKLIERVRPFGVAAETPAALPVAAPQG